MKKSNPTTTNQPKLRIKLIARDDLQQVAGGGQGPTQNLLKAGPIGWGVGA